jgi:hypothetical protein
MRSTGSTGWGVSDHKSGTALGVGYILPSCLVSVWTFPQWKVKTKSINKVSGADPQHHVMWWGIMESPTLPCLHDCPTTFFFFCSIGNWTQGLAHVTQMLYHWATPPDFINLLYYIILFWQDLCLLSAGIMVVCHHARLLSNEFYKD